MPTSRSTTGDSAEGRHDPWEPEFGDQELATAVPTTPLRSLLFNRKDATRATTELPDEAPLTNGNRGRTLRGQGLAPTPLQA
jgi:hypothetical protein